MTPPVRAPGSWFPRFFRFRPRVLVFAGIALFLAAVARFHQPGHGFSSLLSIGDILNDSKVSALRQVPHHVYEGSAGDDGAYTVQLAPPPAPDNPELTKATDNPLHRAAPTLARRARGARGDGRGTRGSQWWLDQCRAGGGNEGGKGIVGSGCGDAQCQQCPQRRVRVTGGQQLGWSGWWCWF